MWIVISDTHIGDKQSNKNLPKLFHLLDSLSKFKCKLILNGDILDFSKSLSFDERHRVFLSLIQKFNDIVYIEGNHDWFISGLGDVFPGISFKKELIINIGNKIIKIFHGHQTDFFVVNLPRFSRFCIRTNKWLYELIGYDLQHIIRDTWFAQKILLPHQEKKLIRMDPQSNIIISGHTHRPCIKNIYGTTYYNTGDWVNSSNMSYAVIHDDGEVELFRL